jgi:hypothetical protein
MEVIPEESHGWCALHLAKGAAKGFLPELHISSDIMEDH